MALTSLYLIDKSAWEQRRYDANARRRISELRRADRLAVCVVTVAELLYSARNAAELERDHPNLSTLRFLTMTPAAETHVVDILRALATKGQHRLPIPDVLVAAIAKAHGATVLHYDRDFELIGAHTPLRHEWIISRGSGHARTVDAGTPEDRS